VEAKLNKLNMRKKYIFDLIGWCGVFTILATYILLNFSIFDSKNIVYQLLNFTGDLAIVFISLKTSSFKLNLVWGFVILSLNNFWFMNIIIKKAKIEDLKTIQNLNYEVFVVSQKYDCYINMRWPFEKEGIKYFRSAIKGRKYCVLIV